MLRSPKSKFAKGPHQAAFDAIAQTPAFEEATLAAMLEMETTLPLDCSPNQAADSHNQMAGARKYLDILCHIHQPETKPKSAEPKGLNWEAGV